MLAAFPMPLNVFTSVLVWDRYSNSFTDTKKDIEHFALGLEPSSSIQLPVSGTMWCSCSSFIKTRRVRMKQRLSNDTSRLPTHAPWPGKKSTLPMIANVESTATAATVIVAPTTVWKAVIWCSPLWVQDQTIQLSIEITMPGDVAARKFSTKMKIWHNELWRYVESNIVVTRSSLQLSLPPVSMRNRKVFCHEHLSHGDWVGRAGVPCGTWELLRALWKYKNKLSTFKHAHPKTTFHKNLWMCVDILPGTAVRDSGGTGRKYSLNSILNVRGDTWKVLYTPSQRDTFPCNMQQQVFHILWSWWSHRGRTTMSH